MQKFVRGNEIVCTGRFVPADGVSYPSSAEAVLAYTDTNGSPAVETIALVETSGVWVGAWDSNAAQEGAVDYVIRCSDGLKAAAQGTFRIVANTANT